MRIRNGHVVNALAQLPIPLCLFTRAFLSQSPFPSFLGLQFGPVEGAFFADYGTDLGSGSTVLGELCCSVASLAPLTVTDASSLSTNVAGV